MHNYTHICIIIVECEPGAKSRLLAVLLRIADILAGFCRQNLRFSNEDPSLVLHAVNAVYLYSLEKWIRLDAGGSVQTSTYSFQPSKRCRFSL